jgi:dTMP kinase
VSFLAFEGGEGCGKSTQAARLARRLGAVLTREPGGTALGEGLRSLLLDGGEVAPRAEALLMAAARAQHVAEVIAPALAAGRHVVTDRFVGSSLAYQGVARGLGVEAVRALSSFAVAGTWPDVVVLLTVAPEVAAARRAGTAPDRMERAGVEFHERVRQAFEELAASDPRWVTVDGGGTADEVEASVWDAVQARIS